MSVDRRLRQSKSRRNHASSDMAGADLKRQIQSDGQDLGFAVIRRFSYVHGFVISRRASKATAVQNANLNANAPTVRVSNGAPRKIRIAKPTAAAAVATAIATARWAAQFWRSHNPNAATTYAPPARKLNQTINRMYFPAHSWAWAGPKSTLPPEMIVIRPKISAKAATGFTQYDIELDCVFWMFIGVSLLVIPL